MMNGDFAAAQQATCATASFAHLGPHSNLQSKICNLQSHFISHSARQATYTPPPFGGSEYQVAIPRDRTTCIVPLLAGAHAKVLGGLSRQPQAHILQ
jgi:hypothetical protein